MTAAFWRKVTAEHIRADVAQRMTHVQPDPAGIREKVKQVELGPSDFAREAIRQDTYRVR
jgi:hypothetical protein